MVLTHHGGNGEEHGCNQKDVHLGFSGGERERQETTSRYHRSSPFKAQNSVNATVDQHTGLYTVMSPAAIQGDARKTSTTLIGIKIYEKSCTIRSQCGLSGQKYTAGYHFNYSNVCCNTDMCNGAVPVAAPPGRGRYCACCRLLYSSPAGLTDCVQACVCCYTENLDYRFVV
ncbi:hypothetical protein NHX12_023081 [Muraenolepis orangiensis]|uniref:Uncharacterized protein n=1 Tax=Muraenolepis orangiensis TaxID=630683 RepID=A0A9Q0EJC9_9TELE|nr:hypothetical protein NHX12_023081 [Muraenolepis orangiensis]